MTTNPGKPNAHTKRFAQEVRDYAGTFPETREDFPWGHSAFKVKGKTFIFMSEDDSGLGLSVKLAESQREALCLPFTEPTHYGMGKHGWVSASFGANENVPIPLLKGWIDESFRLVAPKLVLKRFAESGGATAASKAKATTAKAATTTKATTAVKAKAKTKTQAKTAKTTKTTTTAKTPTTAKAKTGMKQKTTKIAVKRPAAKTTKRRST